MTNTAHKTTETKLERARKAAFNALDSISVKADDKPAKRQSNALPMDAEIYLSPCMTCGAAKGSRCVSKGSVTYYTRVHKARYPGVPSLAAEADWKAAGFVSEKHQRLHNAAEAIRAEPASQDRRRRMKKADTAVRRHVAAIERKPLTETDRRMRANQRAARGMARGLAKK